jgi:tetratricopeptide (TPR) repeat protein
MTPALRTAFITELIGAIRTVHPQFEAFGQRIAPYIAGVPLVHRGLNELGAPVGNVVDSSTADGTVVFEYSADANYFSKPYKKIAKDWCHARRSHAGVRIVYLLSRLESGETAHTRLVNFAGRTKERWGIETHVYDARQLAVVIVDSLLPNDRALDELEPFLGALERIRNSYAATNRVPEASQGYIPRPHLEAMIVGRVRNGGVVSLAGLSGIGKTELAAAVARTARRHYDAVVWVPDVNVASIADLESVMVDRNGRRANVRHLMREYATLLVLDNLASGISGADLLEGSNPGSSILITRQVAQPDDEQVPLLHPDEGRRLLEQRAGSACPAAVFELVWATVSGFPLALKLLGNLAARTSWEDVADSCEAVGGVLDTERVQRLTDRVLGRLQPVLRRELAFLRWCGTARVDRSFARRVLTPAGIQALHDTGLLASEQRGTLRLHDIVKASLDALDPPSPEDANSFAEQLATHIEKLLETGANELGFLNVGHVHRPLLEQLARARPQQPAYLYCLLHVWQSEEFDSDLAGDPIERARAIAAANAAVGDLAVNTILEVIEAAWRFNKQMLGPPAARALLDQHLEAYTLLEGAATITPVARRDVRHQHAKALRNLGRRDEAITLCETLVAEYQGAPTKLLLARLLLTPQSDRATLQRARDLLVEIVEQADKGEHPVGTSVLLATIGEFGREYMDEWAGDITERYRNLIKHTLVEAAARGLPQGLKALADIGRYFGWHDPDRLVDILTDVPRAFTGEATTDEHRAAWGDILLSAGQVDDPAAARQNLERALAFYEELQRPNSFNLQQKGRTLYELGRLDEAAAVLIPLAATDNRGFSRYWLSKVRLAQGDADNALALVEEALGLLPAGSRHMSAFLEHRYDVRIAKADPDAITDLRQALALARAQRHRAQLTMKLAGAH